MLNDPPSPPSYLPPSTTTTTLDPRAPRAVSMRVTPREVDTSQGDAKLTIRIEVDSPLGNRLGPDRSRRFGSANGAGPSIDRIPAQDAGGQTQFLIKAQLSDPIAGISKAPEGGRWGNSVEVIAPSGKVALVGLGYPQAGTGSPERLDFETILNLGSNPELGVWRLKWVQVGDRVGNQRYVPPSELAAAGFPISFTV